MKKSTKIISVILSLAMATSSMTWIAGCKKKTKRDSIIVMSDALDGLFNPFYATTGPDQDVIGMTQIGMLTTNSQGKIDCGANLPTAVLDYGYEIRNNTSGSKEYDKETVYTFVLKNNIVFSDGEPLTMKDVLFNMYEYLDPVYTGSSTMYSTNIRGLNTYRTQSNNGEGLEDYSSKAYDRIDELVSVRNAIIDESASYKASVTPDEIRAKIDSGWPVSQGYKDAVATTAEQSSINWKAQLKEDLQRILDLYKEELERDYEASKSAFDLTTLPYSEQKAYFNNPQFTFLYYEGFITANYVKDKGVEDRSHIESFTYTLDQVKNMAIFKSKDAAISTQFDNDINGNLPGVLYGSASAMTLLDEYTAKATDVELSSKATGGELAYPTIEGIVSLGHNTDASNVTVKHADGSTANYNVARKENLNAKGVPVNSNEYEVLQVTVDGTDPKAIYNFSFTVAPAHYYTAGSYGTDYNYPNGYPVDIANNKFGVVWGSFEYQKNVIQSQQHLRVPVGAGAYVATDYNNKDNPQGKDFYKNNIVYFKSNDKFMFPVQTKKIRFQVVDTSNAMSVLKSGAVDYVTPQLTTANSRDLKALESKGIVRLDAWQLGYGYIGINANKVKNVYLRRAIMAAMNTSLAIGFYDGGAATQISWPMSMVSEAYPFKDKSLAENNWNSMGVTSKTHANEIQNYIGWVSNAKAEEKVKDLMREAANNEGGYSQSDLKLKFTIAGSTLKDHPTYEVFKNAAEILNKCGWSVEVVPDVQALTKLSTGSLAVWAAAWGATIDPDMYQVYDKNSTATNVKAWGYPHLIKDGTEYEKQLLNDLHDKIEDGRSTMDMAERKPIYEEALELVLELAIEMPVYQRKTLYAYNSKVIDKDSMPSTVNPYSNPLEKIWEIKMK